MAINLGDLKKSKKRPRDKEISQSTQPPSSSQKEQTLRPWQSEDLGKRATQESVEKDLLEQIINRPTTQRKKTTQEPKAPEDLLESIIKKKANKSFANLPKN